MYDISCVPLMYTYTPIYDFTNILLIDSTVEDYQTIVESVNSNTMAIVYSYLSTKKELSNILSNFTNISRIGFAFSSNPYNNPVMFLDNKPFFNGYKLGHSYIFLLEIFKKYNVDNVDFLACNTLLYPQWKNFYYNLIENSSIIVGASNNETGNIKYGGDWILENIAENIELIYFTTNIEYYKYLLDTLNFVNFTGINQPDTTSSFNALCLLNQVGNANTNGYLLMSSTNSPGNLLLVNTGSNLASPIPSPSPGWQKFYVSYATYGMAQLYSPLSSLYYLYVARSGSIMRFSNFGGPNNSGPNSVTSATFCTIATLYTYSGVEIDSTNNYLYVSATNGIYQVKITDSTSPTGGTPLLWANTAAINAIITCGESCIYGIAISNGYLFAMIKGQGVVRITINTDFTLGTITIYSNSSLISTGSALLTNNNILYIATQNTPSSGTSNYGTGNIYTMSTISGTLSLYKGSTYYPANNGLATDGINLYMLCAGNSGTTNQSSYISLYSVKTENIGINPTGILYKSGASFIDICNNFTSINVVTTPTFNGQNFSTGIFCYYNSIKYDLAQLYTLNTIIVEIPAITTNIFTRYNSSLYDINSFFNPNSSFIIGGTYSISGNSASSVSGSNDIYTFTSLSGTLTLTVNQSIIVSILSLGGGGGGGFDGGGGGGGGGVYTNNLILSAGTYNITIGGGGAAATSGSAIGSNGGNSSFIGGSVNIISYGGGGGGNNHNTSPAGNGGNGGGQGAADAPNIAGTFGTGISGQGNNGGASLNNGSGGGGGGYSAAGDSGISNKGGNGGNGILSAITGTNTWYGGGGGGGTWAYSTGGTGGLGGGGNGGTNTNVQNATFYGGGGGGGGNASFIAGSGNQGVCIISIPTSYRTPLVSSLTTPSSNWKACFSLKLLVQNYTGFIINIRRASDNNTMSFYSTVTGILTSQPNGAGTAIATFLSATTGYVTTWYDQSGKNNHATQTNTSFQPIIDLTNNCLDFGYSNNQNLYFDIPNGTVPVGVLNASYSFVVKHGNTINGNNGGFIGAGTGGVSNQVNSWRFFGSTRNYRNYWWGNDFDYGNEDTTIPIVAAVTYNGSTFIHNGYRAAVLARSLSRQGGTTSNAAQSIGRTAVNEYLKGQMYALLIFSAALPESDVIILNGL